jgi:hypothetical protein
MFNIVIARSSSIKPKPPSRRSRARTMIAIGSLRLSLKGLDPSADTDFSASYSG